MDRDDLTTDYVTVEHLGGRGVERLTIPATDFQINQSISVIEEIQRLQLKVADLQFLVEKLQKKLAHRHEWHKVI